MGWTSTPESRLGYLHWKVNHYFRWPLSDEQRDEWEETWDEIRDLEAQIAQSHRDAWSSVADSFAAIVDAIPAPGDPRDERENELLVASMELHFGRDEAGKEEYKEWKEAHAETRKARDAYRHAADEADKAAKRAAEPDATDKDDKDARRKAEAAEEARKEYNKKLIEEERIAGPGEANCSRNYAELCIEDAWNQCFWCRLFGGTCTCSLMISPGMEWEPETQKELRENSRQGSGNGNGQDQNGDGDRAGGGGGPGRAADPAAPRGVAPGDIAAGVGRNEKAGKGAKERGTVAPDDSTETPVGPEDDPKKDKPGRKGIAGVDPRAPSVAIQGKVSGGGPTVPSSDEEKKKTVAPSGGSTTTEEPETTTEHKPTVTPDDSSTTGTDAATTKRDCTDCEAALNSIAGGVGASLATMQGDLECVWAAASRTTGANGKPLTEGLDRSQIDAGLAALAAGKGVVGATVLEKSVKKALIDLIDTLAGRCRRAVRAGRGTVAPSAGPGTPPIVASPPPPDEKTKAPPKPKTRAERKPTATPDDGAATKSPSSRDCMKRLRELAKEFRRRLNTDKDATSWYRAALLEFVQSLPKGAGDNVSARGVSQRG